jgi:hypothetical protein
MCINMGRYGLLKQIVLKQKYWHPAKSGASETRPSGWLIQVSSQARVDSWWSI